MTVDAPSLATPFPWKVSVVAAHEDPRGPLWKIEGPDTVTPEERVGRYVPERRVLIGEIDGPMRNGPHAQSFFRVIRALGAMSGRLSCTLNFVQQAKERGSALGMPSADHVAVHPDLLELQHISLPSHNWEVEERDGAWRVLGRKSRGGDLGIATVFTSRDDAERIADAPIFLGHLYDALEELVRWGNLLLPTSEHIFAQCILLDADHTESRLREVHGLPDLPREEFHARQQSRIDVGAPQES